MFLHASERGFTLLETLVATSILVTTLAGVAQLFILGTHLTRQAGASGGALVAAQDKLESLRGEAFTYDSVGFPVTAPALQPSPPTTLGKDTGPYVDWLDVDGVASETAKGAIMVRRWRISSLGATTPDAIAIEVCVFRAPGVADPRGADACLSTIRARQP
jgi:prepilin-type N-terminal cleavage/methylation domain-containing protein